MREPLIAARWMELAKPGTPLQLATRRVDRAGPGQVLVRVSACGVCRTDLHIVDGELPALGRVVVPGHEIVGTVIEAGLNADELRPGQRVGIPWLGWTCGRCAYCASGRENLCAEARFTGYQIDGGYADFAIADARYCFPLPDSYGDAEAAPLLCAGLIGYRALVMAGDARRLGIYGFGAAAHIDQLGAGLVLQNGVCFGGQQRALIRQPLRARSLAGGLENCFDVGHQKLQISI